jgi:hypothetical protein
VPREQNPVDTAGDKAYRAMDRYLITGTDADKAKADAAMSEYEKALKAEETR